MSERPAPQRLRELDHALITDLIARQVDALEGWERPDGQRTEQRRPALIIERPRRTCELEERVGSNVRGTRQPNGRPAPVRLP